MNQGLRSRRRLRTLNEDVSPLEGATNIVDIEIQKAQLKLTLNVPKGKLVDNLNIAEDVSSKGKWGNGAYQITMKDESHLSHILSLIEQSVQLHQ